MIRAPAGDGRVAAIARHDIARAAERILTNPAAHQNSAYDLTGIEAVSFNELAATLSYSRGQTITYHRESIEEAYEYRRRWAPPKWQYDAWVSTYTAIAAGQMSGVSHDVERITGTPPILLNQMLASRTSK